MYAFAQPLAKQDARDWTQLTNDEVSPRMAIEDAVVLWLVGTLTGSMVLSATVVSPKVFRTLPPEHAGVFLRACFPAYYVRGFAISLLAALAAIASGWLISAACALVMISFVFARQALLPRISAVRDVQTSGDSAPARRCKSLHLVSVLCSAAQALVPTATATFLIRNA